MLAPRTRARRFAEVRRVRACVATTDPLLKRPLIGRARAVDTQHVRAEGAAAGERTWVVPEKAGRAAEVLPRERRVLLVVRLEVLIQLLRPRHAVQHLLRCNQRDKARSVEASWNWLSTR